VRAGIHATNDLRLFQVAHGVLQERPEARAFHNRPGGTPFPTNADVTRSDLYRPAFFGSAQPTGGLAFRLHDGTRIRTTAAASDCVPRGSAAAQSCNCSVPDMIVPEGPGRSAAVVDPPAVRSQPLARTPCLTVPEAVVRNRTTRPACPALGLDRADVDIISRPGGSIMRRSVLLPGVLVLVLSACSGPPPGADQRRAAQDDLNPSGRPYDGPPGVVTSGPPADNSGARLHCHPEGPGTVCSRDP
jgi:hypothetical protein